MSKTPIKSDTGQLATADYMLIKIGYSCQLIFPIEEAINFIKSYNKAVEYKKEYKEPVKIYEVPPDMEISYLSKFDIGKMALDKALGLDDEEDL